MKLYQSNKIRFVSGLVLILIVYSLHYIYIEEDEESLLVLPEFLIHLIRFAVTVLVYGIGTVHLGKLKDVWMSKVWHLIHISGLIIMGSLGGFNWLFMDISLYLRQFVKSIQEILISPVLYLAIGLLNNRLKKE